MAFLIQFDTKRLSRTIGRQDIRFAAANYTICRIHRRPNFGWINVLSEFHP